ncbi:MAG TPA: type II toxin-antitoxin system HipA family toxinoxin YjjJ [Rheinheimera sp.]|nr:type II toxin-antitoxin system HipA family toxinoxin YjjJ [Rheinheimera sp.]
MTSSTIDAILDCLRQNPASSTELAQACRCDRSTITRQLKQLDSMLVSTGRARATRYYLRRGAAADTTLYRISEAGQAQHYATLVAVMPHGYLVQTAAQDHTCFYDDLPWWLQDLRPQGFLGRNLAKSLFSMGIVATDDIDYWQDSDVFNALLHARGDSPGNMLIGTLSYQAWLQQEPVPCSEADFVALANSAMAGDVVGSSAGGEQPKFCAYVDGSHRLVKFSEPVTNANSQRWADLLIAEHLALNVLADAGIPATRSQLVQREQRTFLSAERFDRIGALGRKGVVSLRMAEMQFVGRPAEWPVIANQLHQQQRISAADAMRIAVVWCFGRLIANTDMHTGNLSFYYTSDTGLTLAPIYDMLPMAFAPQRSGAMASSFSLSVTPVVDGTYWRQAYPLAEQFWQQLAKHSAVSLEFKAIAAAMLGELQTKQRLIERMA